MDSWLPQCSLGVIQVGNERVGSEWIVSKGSTTCCVLLFNDHGQETTLPRNFWFGIIWDQSEKKDLDSLGESERHLGFERWIQCVSFCPLRKPFKELVKKSKSKNSDSLRLEVFEKRRGSRRKCGFPTTCTEGRGESGWDAIYVLMVYIYISSHKLLKTDVQKVNGNSFLVPSAPWTQVLYESKRPWSLSVDTSH